MQPVSRSLLILIWMSESIFWGIERTSQTSRSAFRHEDNVHPAEDLTHAMKTMSWWWPHWRTMKYSKPCSTCPRQLQYSAASVLDMASWGRFDYSTGTCQAEFTYAAAYNLCSALQLLQVSLVTLCSKDSQLFDIKEFHCCICVHQRWYLYKCSHNWCICHALNACLIFHWAAEKIYTLIICTAENSLYWA